MLVIARPTLHIVDDEPVVRASVVSLLQAHSGFACREYPSGEAFLATLDRLESGCVVLDLHLKGVSGLNVVKALAGRPAFRTVIMTGMSDLATAADAYRAGAIDFLYKPCQMAPLLEAVERAFHQIEHGCDRYELIEEARSRLARLAPVENRILAGLVSGQTNQDIATALKLDARSVQLYRARALAAIEAPSLLAAMRTTAIAGAL